MFKSLEVLAMGILYLVKMCYNTRICIGDSLREVDITLVVILYDHFRHIVTHIASDEFLHLLFPSAWGMDFKKLFQKFHKKKLLLMIDNFVLCLKYRLYRTDFVILSVYLHYLFAFYGVIKRIFGNGTRFSRCDIV